MNVGQALLLGRLCHQEAPLDIIQGIQNEVNTFYHCRSIGG